MDDLEEEVNFDENYIFPTIPATLALHNYSYSGGYSPTCDCGKCDCLPYDTLIYGYKYTIKSISHKCMNCLKQDEERSRRYSTDYICYYDDYNYYDDEYYDEISEDDKCYNCDINITGIPHVTEYMYINQTICENCSSTCETQIKQSTLTSRYDNKKLQYFKCNKCKNIFNFEYLTDENGYALYSSCLNNDYTKNCYPIRCIEKFNKCLLGHNKDCSDLPIINSIDYYINSYDDHPGQMFYESDEKWEKTQREVIINAKDQMKRYGKKY